MASSLNYSKRMLGHTYMSSSIDMTQIATNFADTPTDAFVIRAAAKAYQATITSRDDVMKGEETTTLNVSRVMSHSERVTYIGVEDLRIGQIA